jgi:branched-chain amino acid transport system ATP-binding protein
MTSGYAGVPVVRRLDLVVEPGEVVALLGPNGAGKTTTLTCLAGILPTLGGEVKVLGAPVAAGRPHLVARRGCAFVPDDRSLLFSLSVRENLRLGLGRKAAKAGIQEVLSYFPSLEPRLGVRAGALSGGEQQMLAIGRAIVRRPRALMIDELSLGLAPVLVKGILPVTRRIAVEHGIGVLLVEQHVDLALETADRAYVMSHGDVVLSGRASDLASRRDLLTASYLGEVSDIYAHDQEGSAE